MTANDWGARLRKGAIAAQEAVDKGDGAPARFMATDVRPYIGMRIHEGAIAPSWFTSDEAFADVSRELREVSGCDSLKGLAKGSREYDITRAVQAMVNNAAKLFRAVTILTDQTGLAPEWDAKGGPTFPVQWLLSEEHVLLARAGTIPRVTIRKRGYIVMLEAPDDGTATAHEIKMTQDALLKASGLRKPRETGGNADDGNASSDISGSLVETLNAAAGFMAKADNVVAGDAADAFLDMVRAFVEASERNRAAIEGILEEAARKSANKVSSAA